MTDGMFGAKGTGDTSGYGGLVRQAANFGSSERPYGSYFDEIADDLERAYPDFSDAIEILKKLQLPTFTLLTNNPYKINLLREASFNFEVKSIQTTPTPQNRKYLSDKASIGAHSIFLHL